MTQNIVEYTETYKLEKLINSFIADIQRFG